MTRTGVRPAWLAPTVRAIAWRPVLGGLGAVVAALSALEASSAPPLSAALVSLALAVVAALVLHALDDPAHALLAALPTSALQRVVHRLAATLAVVLVVGAAALVAGVGGIDDVPGPPLAEAFAALLAAGVLLHVALTAHRPGQTAMAAGLPVLWAVLASVTEPDGAGALAHGWSTHPWPVALGAIVAVVALDRGRWRAPRR